VLQLTTDDGLPGNCVRAVCQDAEGNVWVGTAGGGLTRLKPRKIQTLSTRDGLSHNAITALAEDAQGALWIGTDGGGLNCWKDGKAEPCTPSYVLDNQTISSLAWRDDGALWLGTSGGGAFRLPMDKSGSEAGGGGQLEHFGEVQGLPGRLVSALCPDKTGRLWLGTLDGGPVCLTGGKTAGRPPELEALSGQPVTAILEDTEGALWFGTNGQGASRLETSTNRLTRWGGPFQGLASSFIRTLRLDSRGAVWAGTNGGLTRWRSGRIFNFTPRHGLTNAVVSQILDGGDGHLWLGTNAGVMRIPFDSLDAVEDGRAGELEVLTLGTNDGLPSLECTGGCQPAGARLSDGRLCFGTVAGLAVIRPDDFAPGKTAPPVVIESCTVGAGAPVMNAGTGGPGLKAPPNTERLGFEFTALCPGSPDRVRFRYRLAGLEKSWVEADAGAGRTAVYTHPEPGDYVFEVLASAGGGPWSPVPARLAVTVLAPWWRQPWAMGTGGLLAVGMVAGLARTVTRRRLQRRVRELERQFALERERSRIARDIHDDLGASLTRISLLSAVGRERCQDPDRARDQFAAIDRTSGELVQAMDAIVWAVNPAQDTLESLARYLVRFAGDLFAQSGVRLRLEVPTDLPRAVLPSEIRHNLFLATKEALNNALNHSKATEVRLSLRAESGGGTPDPITGILTVSVEDNGCGFIVGEGDKTTGGNGLGNMRHRLMEGGGTCGVSSSPGRGTRIIFTLPVILQ
jgi:signal transduction histidine kinase